MLYIIYNKKASYNGAWWDQVLKIEQRGDCKKTTTERILGQTLKIITLFNFYILCSWHKATGNTKLCAAILYKINKDDGQILHVIAFEVKFYTGNKINIPKSDSEAIQDELDDATIVPLEILLIIACRNQGKEENKDLLRGTEGRHRITITLVE